MDLDVKTDEGETLEEYIRGWVKFFLLESENNRLRIPKNFLSAVAFQVPLGCRVWDSDAVNSEGGEGCQGGEAKTGRREEEVWIICIA